MIVSLIAALDENGGIGWQGKLPWRLSGDLQLFKTLTMGHHLVVGRKTWEAIGRPLPGRKIIVVSRQPGIAGAGGGVLAAASLEEALALAQSAGETEAFIGGGAEIYALALPLAQRIYLTRVHASGPADVFFPRFDAAGWRVIEQAEYPAGGGNQYAFTWQRLERSRIPAGNSAS